MVVAKGWGRGSGKFLNGYRVLFLKDEKVLEIGNGNIPKTTELYTQK